MCIHLVVAVFSYRDALQHVENVAVLGDNLGPAKQDVPEPSEDVPPRHVHAGLLYRDRAVTVKTVLRCPLHKNTG